MELKTPILEALLGIVGVFMLGLLVGLLITWFALSGIAGQQREVLSLEIDGRLHVICPLMFFSMFVFSLGAWTIFGHSGIIEVSTMRLILVVLAQFLFCLAFPWGLLMGATKKFVSPFLLLVIMPRKRT